MISKIKNTLEYIKSHPAEKKKQDERRIYLQQQINNLESQAPSKGEFWGAVGGISGLVGVCGFIGALSAKSSDASDASLTIAIPASLIALICLLIENNQSKDHSEWYEQNITPLLREMNSISLKYQADKKNICISYSFNYRIK